MTSNLFDAIFTFPTYSPPVEQLDFSKSSTLLPTLDFLNSSDGSEQYQEQSGMIPSDKGSCSFPSPSCTTSLSLPTNSDKDLTLCTVAYDMIKNHNTRGVDMIEIGIRLWNGFVKGEGDSGCKVQNKLLFGVLEYISVWYYMPLYCCLADNLSVINEFSLPESRNGFNEVVRYIMCELNIRGRLVHSITCAYTIVKIVTIGSMQF